MAVVCTGSIAYDYLMTFPGYFRDHILPDRLDTISLSFLVDSMVRQRGGTAPNICFTMALLGERTLLMGTVGEDFEDYRVWLESKGVDTANARVVPGKYTASFFANTDLANNQISSFYTGAMANASELTVRSIGDRPDLVVISPNDPAAMDAYVCECKDLRIPYLYDPSQQIVRVKAEELARGVDGAQSVFVNEYEFDLLQKHTGLKAADILKLVEYLVVTCGERGAEIFVGDQKYSIPAIPPDQIADPTGVGDAFRGGFLRGIRLGLGFQIAGEIGALAATYCLEQRGTQNHCYTRHEFVERFRRHFDDQGALDALLK